MHGDSPVVSLHLQAANSFTAKPPSISDCFRFM